MKTKTEFTANVLGLPSYFSVECDLCQEDKSPLLTLNVTIAIDDDVEMVAVDIVDSAEGSGEPALRANKLIYVGK